MMMATILHNPRCSKSREALAILEAAGAEVTVIDYLKAPPSAADLKALYARAGMTPREGLRNAETGAKADRKGVVSGKSVSLRLGRGGRRISNKKKNTHRK